MDYSVTSLVDRSGWSSILEQAGVDNMYLSWGYVQAIKLSHPVDTYLFHTATGDSGLFSVFSVREPLPGYQEIYSPYGFGGFCSYGEFSENLTMSWRGFLQDKGYISAFLMLHPLLRLENETAIGLKEHNTVFSLDLRQEKSTLWTGLRKGHKYEIKRAEKNPDLKILINDEVPLDRLIALYQATHSRVGASSTYDFSEETLQMIVNAEDSLVMAASINGQVEALAIFLTGRKIAEYFISAASVSGRNFTRFLIWQAIDIFKDRKLKMLHLGGGVRGGDDLESFKRRFGGQDMCLQVIKYVADHKRFDELCSHFDTSVDQSNYFPPYWEKIRSNE